MKQTLIIAEIGVNHNGSITLAMEMIVAAKNAGADIVKFQTYKANEVMTDQTPLAAYMDQSDKSFLDLARRLELTYDETLDLQRFAIDQKIEFLSSPFDVESCKFLGSIGMRRLKIPSGETVNPFVLSAAAATGLPLILSTGMATLDDIHRSMNYLKRLNSGPITLLHCTTQYPAEPQFSNLLAMATMEKEFRVPIGYSDHTEGIEISLAAAALGATVIEKHFTLDRNLPGPDQKSSLEPIDFKALVNGVRNIDVALGNGQKQPWPAELEVARVARKSVVTVRNLSKGHIISIVDLTAKRPGTGIPAMDADKVVGRRLIADVAQDTLLQWSSLV